MSRKGKKRVEPTAVLTDMLQVTSLAMKILLHQTTELRLEGIRLETLKFVQERLQDLLQHIKNVCMKLFITKWYLLDRFGIYWRKKNE